MGQKGIGNRGKDCWREREIKGMAKLVSHAHSPLESVPDRGICMGNLNSGISSLLSASLCNHSILLTCFLYAMYIAVESKMHSVLYRHIGKYIPYPKGLEYMAV